MNLQIIPCDFSICKVKRISDINLNAEFCFIGRTDEEISLVCMTEDVPSDTVARDDGWRGFRIQGELDFSLTGILSKLSGILAAEKIGVFAISTYNTDYVLVKSENLERAARALRSRGYNIGYVYD